MSLKTNINKLDNETISKINKDLIIKEKPDKYNKFARPKEVVTYIIENQDIYIPFAYAVNELKIKRPEREIFPSMNVKFAGTLRDEQKIVKKEAMDFLSKNGSILLSIYPGFGKCLGLDTPILMYDGTVKMVQYIKINDVIMGDDSTPRNVLSICKGKEQMYEIKPIKGESFTCNESHILSLKISTHKSIFKLKTGKVKIHYFNKVDLKWDYYYYDSEEDAKKNLHKFTEDDILDISVKNYLSLSKTIKDKLKCYKVGINFDEKPVTLDPYMVGLWLGDGTTLKAQITNVDENVIKYLHEFCEIHSQRLRQDKNTENKKNDITYNFYGSIYGDISTNILLTQLKKYDLLGNKHIPYDYKINSRDIRLKVLAGLIDSDGYYNENCYEIVQKIKKLSYDILYLVRSLGFAAYIKKVKKSCMYKGKKREGIYYLISFFGEGLENIPVLLEYKKAHKRKQRKNALVNGFKIKPIDDTDYYGFMIDGNHRFLLGDFTVTHNTYTSINIATNIKLKTLIIVNKIVLINQWEQAIETVCPDAKIQKLTSKSKLEDCDFYIMNAINVPKMKHNFFKSIGFLIVDEVHLILAETLSKSLQYISPRYSIFLSATAYREDFLNKLFNLYAGPNKIIRKLQRVHTVYKIKTNFKPIIEHTANGTVNWGKIIESLSNNYERNEQIIKIVKTFSDRNILILSKRVEQSRYLFDRLKEEGENVQSLIGKEQSFDRECRVLVGITGKCGTGFDFNKLDCLIMAVDVESYFEQNLGRIMRTKEVDPLVFDIVDDNPILDKHFRTRKDVYTEAGGKIVDFNKKFPHFFE